MLCENENDGRADRDKQKSVDNLDLQESIRRHT